MIPKIIFFWLFLLTATSLNALNLDWRSVPIQSIDYTRHAVKGGGAIYTLRNTESLKFKVQFVFAESEFSLPRKDITTLSATADMLLLGGFGRKNFAQIEKELTSNGVQLSTYINSLGELTISCEALEEDFTRVMNLLSDLILKPRFDSKALKLWKQQSNNAFANFSNASSLGAQMKFIDAEASRLAFGKNHYLSTEIQRSAPKSIRKVQLEKIKTIYNSVRNRNGLQVMLSGSYPINGSSLVKKLMLKIPSKNSATAKWLPARLEKSSSKKIKVALIRKNDMTQSQVTLRYYYPEMGELNPFEKAQIKLLSEIYSSTGGVVGNDRFSKALRADSGLSYSPRAFFAQDIITPNTNVSAFIMRFQSPNDRTYDAISIAQKTWKHFLKKGITPTELTNTRTAVMNSMLANELTVFDKANFVFSKILAGKVPPVNPIQESLESIESQQKSIQLNNFIKEKLANPAVGVLVIMGNPSAKEINRIKSISDLDFIEITNVNSLKE